jgi:hypothetical protein
MLHQTKQTGKKPVGYLLLGSNKTAGPTTTTITTTTTTAIKFSPILMPLNVA